MHSGSRLSLTQFDHVRIHPTAPSKMCRSDQILPPTSRVSDVDWQSSLYAVETKRSDSSSCHCLGLGTCTLAWICDYGFMIGFKYVGTATRTLTLFAPRVGCWKMCVTPVRFTRYSFGN